MKTIIIDAGHGGSDSGAIGYGVLEKTWTLKMSLYQYNRLKELGAKVAITRSSDQTLEPVQRAAKVKSNYTYCLSNHFNAFDGKARGVEAIHSLHASGRIAKGLADAVVEASNLPLRRVFIRTAAKSKNTDYYYMHRLTGSTQTVILEYGFIDNVDDFKYYNKEENFYKVAENVVKFLTKILDVSYKPPEQFKQKTSGNTPKPKTNVASYIGKRVESIYPGKLRFYNKPSWKDQDVFGYVKKGEGFPEIINKIKVGSGYQYKVKNSKGAIYYITASSEYVRIV